MRGDSLDRAAPRLDALPLFRVQRSPASPPLSEADQVRLGRQQAAVLALMADGAWRSLAAISEATGAPEASASARLRSARKMGYRVERRREGAGYLYRVGGRDGAA